MEPWVPVVITAAATFFASSGFWAFLTRRSTVNKATTRLLMGLAYDKIAQLGLSYIDRGWISKDEFEDFRKFLYEPYEALGGNGVAQRIMEEVQQLPLRGHSKFAEIIQQRRSTEMEVRNGPIS